MIEAQQLGQPASIDLVALVAALHRGILSRIAHTILVTWGLSRSYNQSAPGPFLKGDVKVPALPVDKLQNDARFRLHHTFQHDLSCIIHDRDRNAFLVHIHTDILFVYPLRAFLSVGIEASTQPYSKGAPLYIASSSRKLAVVLSGPQLLWRIVIRLAVKISHNISRKMGRRAMPSFRSLCRSFTTVTLVIGSAFTALAPATAARSFHSRRTRPRLDKSRAHFKPTIVPDKSDRQWFIAVADPSTGHQRTYDALLYMCDLGDQKKSDYPRGNCCCRNGGRGSVCDWAP